MRKIRILIILITGLMIYTYLVANVVHFANRNARIDSNPSLIPRSMHVFIDKVSYSLVNLKDNHNRGYIKNTEINNGFTFFEEESTIDSLFMLTSYELGRHKSEIVLYDVNNNKTIKKWNPPMKSISNLSYDDERVINKGKSVYLGHPLMLKDSSIIGETQFSLVRINSNSEIDWVNNGYAAHHSVEQGPDGFIWICGRRNKTKLKNIIKDENEDFKLRFYDDLIMKIDPLNGGVVFEKSVIEILQENNLGYLLFQNGYVELDPIHLNDVQPAMYDGDFWKKGDLLVSCRHLSMVFLYRPSTNELLWHKQGSWLNQHDPDFYKEDKIVVFGNQVFIGKESPLFSPPYDYNSVFVYDFKKDTIYEPFKKMIEKNNIKTNSEGRCDILPNGDIFIEETNSGRIIIGDSINKKVEFAKRINDKYIAYLHWSRIISK
ncbi:MAG: hypothetical protein GY834_05470 [Bacteroidetes bacterium]|nr:hypothetical protein [Bacteroidota bacterium]